MCRVVVVDDSPVQRRYLRRLLAAAPDMEVVGEATNGEDVLALVRDTAPDVVVMDLELPRLHGVAAIERVMAERPTPIVAHSGYVDGPHAGNRQAALSAGAIAVVAKPAAGRAESAEDLAAELLGRIRAAAGAPVITHPRGRLPLPVAAPPGQAPASAPAGPAPQPAHGAGGSATDVDLVVIGASTGGPQVVAATLAALPLGLPAAVLVVQHIAAGFVPGFATWLAGQCALPVSVAHHGGRLAPGTVSVAPSGGNVIVGPGLRVVIEAAPPGQHHVPGIDATFASAARTCGQRAVGVLLTGMGRDGAAGLAALRAAGAMTIAQDERTSTVYGMPAAAVALGAACRQLAAEDIGPALAELVQPSGVGQAC